MNTPELAVAVQQELDLDDLCPNCNHPVDECVCPERPFGSTAPDREEAQPPEPYGQAWKCPYCNHLNSELNRYCAECGEMYGEEL